MDRRALFPLLTALLVGCPSETAPADPEPFGPENRWWHTTTDRVPSDTDGWELVTGAVLSDIHFRDQFDEPVQLHQFAGRMLIIDFVASWCGPCRDTAPELQAFADSQDEEDGVLVITLVAEGFEGGPTVQEEVEEWAESNELTMPVLRIDTDVADNPAPYDLDQFPSPFVIGQDMRMLGRFYPLPYDDIEAAAAGDPDTPEDCSDGLDNDADLATDCGDVDCIDTASCPLGFAEEGELRPCWDNEERSTDVYEIVVGPGGKAMLEVDTVSADTTFDARLVEMQTPDDSFSVAGIWADHGLACTFAPSAGSCPRKAIDPGTWLLSVATKKGDEGRCADPLRGGYVFRGWGDVSATLVRDDRPAYP